MLGYNSGNCKKSPSIKSVCEDIENNNNNNVKNEQGVLYNEKTAVQYSSNSKGVFAQVR